MCGDVLLIEVDKGRTASNCASSPYLAFLMSSPLSSEMYLVPALIMASVCLLSQVSPHSWIVSLIKALFYVSYSIITDSLSLRSREELR